MLRYYLTEKKLTRKLLIYPYIINFHHATCKHRVNGASKVAAHCYIKNEEKYQIFLKPFRKNYNKQNAIKESLNLSNEFSGEASVIISKD